MEEYKLVVGLGAIAAYLIRFAQRSKYFPWITAEAHRITLAVQAVLSLLVSLGISYTWNPDAHSLLISGLSLRGIMHGVITWVSQFAVQHGFTNILSLGDDAPSGESPPATQGKAPTPATPGGA